MKSGAVLLPLSSDTLLGDVVKVKQFLAHWELYRMLGDVPGDIVECGVFKGKSLLHWALFREVEDLGRRIVAFDTFGKFPAATYEPDIEPRSRFIALQGDMSLSTQEIRDLVAEACGSVKQLELVEGDICQTVPRWAMGNSWTEVALLHLDADLYEPSHTAIKYFWPLLVPGGIVISDNYGTFPGEMDAVGEFTRSIGLRVEELDRFPGCFYIVKKG